MIPLPDSSPSVPRSVTSDAPDAGRVQRVTGLRARARRPPGSPPTAVAEPPDDASADFDGWNAFHTCPHGSLE